MVKENTQVLTKAEKMSRKETYKNLSDDEHKTKKLQLDAALHERVTRCRIVKLMPSSSQRLWLLKVFRDARTTYNLALGHLLNNNVHKMSACDLNMTLLEDELRRTFVRKLGVLALHPRHHKLLRTPNVPRDQAVKAVLAVFKAHHTREKKRLFLKAKFPDALAFKDCPRFCPGFKRKKMKTSDSISIEKKSIRVVNDSTIGLYSTRKFGKTIIFENIRTQAGMNSIPVECDFKVHFRHGNFCLILPFRRPPKSRVPLPRVESIVAIDPGVRVPFTVYSPEGSVAEIGVNCTRVLDKHLRRIDKSKAHVRDVYAQVVVERECRFLDRKLKRNQRQRLRRARKKCQGVEDKAKRVIRDFQYKTAHYLLQRFKTIVLPHTSSHRWRTNNLATVTKRRSMMLRHGMFASRLIQTATDYEGSRIIRCSEAYTSKQCGACGELNDKLGGSKTFHCEECGAVADRDIHAARNILLRCLE